VAWDRYAKRGLGVVLGDGAPSQFRTYAEYLKAFDQVWDGQEGQRIRNYLAGVDMNSAVESEPRFQRRVLDVYLMK